MMNTNPILKSDYPDPDVIRVGDTYYMISTTMHFMPGGVILRSYDLINWEIATYVFDSLDDTPVQCLEGDQCIYGKGMWAASLRYHKGTFYVCFVANDTHKTYLYQAEDIYGPWRKQYVEGFYHDCSLLFDEDDRVYIVYGNTDIYLTELKADLTGPKPDGVHRMIVTEKDKSQVRLGYEGSHLYKINGKYYLFLIHWPVEAPGRRTEACFVAESLEGEFIGKDVFDDDLGYHDFGVAQGGIVDTPEGEWYAMLFQDHGAVGRIPVLVPMHWEEDFPVLGIAGKAPLNLSVKSTRPEYHYEPLEGSDNFCYSTNQDGADELKSFWQWNHTPQKHLWSVTEQPGVLRIHTGKLSINVGQAVNTLTQRTVYPRCEAAVTVDASIIRSGDYAGICALQGCYGLIAITREEKQYYLVMLAKVAENEGFFARPGDKEPGTEFARIPIDSCRVTLKVSIDFTDGLDEANFYYQDKGEWQRLGITHKLYFKMDHFTGCRFGLFNYATKEIGGAADFSDFIYIK
jgi:beta-xylosidase